MFSIGAGLVRHWFDIDNTGHVINIFRCGRISPHLFWNCTANMGALNFERTHVNQVAGNVPAPTICGSRSSQIVDFILTLKICGLLRIQVWILVYKGGLYFDAANLLAPII